MRTRKAATPPAKKQPVRKCTTKSPFNSSGSASGNPVTPSTGKRAAAVRTKRAKKDEEASPATAAASPVADSKPEVPSGENAEGSLEMQVPPARQGVAFTRSAAKRAAQKNKAPVPDKLLSYLEDVSGASIITRIEHYKENEVDAEINTSDRLLSEQDPESGNSMNSRIKDSKQKTVMVVKDTEIIASDSLLSEQETEFGDSMKPGNEDFKKVVEVELKDVEVTASETFLSQGACDHEGSTKSIIEEAEEKESVPINNMTLTEEDIDKVGECVEKEHSTMEVEMPADENAGDPKTEESKTQIKIIPFACFEEFSIEEKSIAAEVIMPLDTMKPGELMEEEAVEEEPEEQDPEGVKDNEELNVLSSNVKGNNKEDFLGEDSQIANNEYFINVRTKKYVGKVDLDEHGEEEIVEEDFREPVEENEALEEEHAQLSAMVKELNSGERGEEKVEEENLQEPVEENEALEEEHAQLSAMVKEPNIGKFDLGERGEEKIEEENLQEPVEENEAVEEECRELSAMAKEQDFRKVYIGEHEEEEIEVDHPEPVEGNEALEEEHMQLSAMAKERKIRKEHEIFVGGFDRDATEEDIRKVFEIIGELVEVRLHKNLLADKNNGRAFVTFSSKENARRALAEIKNPIIAGKRCRIAPSEDNNTLFLGNICNSWTKEAIKQKLKEYGVEGFEKITLVPDVQHEGLSRGFAFIEFFCHSDAMLAYKRLQKPDVIFGHAERTVKVAFAAPLQEPDPEVMAQVKSVFIDGIPPNLSEAQLRERLKGYGDIVRIFLSRNMPTAKRKDFGFVDFSTNKDAVACVQGLNNTEFGDGNFKTKIKARLSNPLPKTQAVKGGMCGGFRIGHGSGGPPPKYGKNFERGGNSFNHLHFMRGRGFNQGGQVPRGRIGFQNNFEYENPYPEFNRRQDIGGRRGSVRGGHFSSVRGGAVSASSRPLLDGWRNPSVREYGFDISHRQQPYTSEAHLDRSYLRPQFDAQYNFIDNVQGTKRPYSMMEPGPDYIEPARFRQRFDYSSPVGPLQGNHYRDNYGSGSSSQFPNNIYGPDYGVGPRSSFYRGGHSFGRGYYY